MQLLDLLPREHILVPLRVASVADAIAALLRQLLHAGAVTNPEALPRVHPEVPLRDVVPVGDSAVLPHFRTDAVDRLVMAVGVAPAPLDPGESGLEMAPRIVVLILAPPGAATLYLQTIATVARLLRQDTVVDRITAAATPDDLLDLPELRELRIQPRLTVRDIMTHQVDRVGSDATVREVVDLMVRRRTRAIPVVGDKGEVLGVVTERDVMRALLPQIPRAGEEQTPSEVVDARQPRARDIMTRSVLCVSEDMGLEEVANMMINKDVEQLPVVSEGKLSGVVTRADMIRKLFGR